MIETTIEHSEYIINTGHRREYGGSANKRGSDWEVELEMVMQEEGKGSRLLRVIGSGYGRL